MPRFEIVTADTPEPEAVEKPVQWKWSIDANGSLRIYARQNGEWVWLAFCPDNIGKLCRCTQSLACTESLPGVKFDSHNQWDTNE